MKSNSIQSNPIQSNPIQSNPIQSNHVKLLCLIRDLAILSLLLFLLSCKQTTNNVSNSEDAGNYLYVISIKTGEEINTILTSNLNAGKVLQRLRLNLQMWLQVAVLRSIAFPLK